VNRCTGTDRNKAITFTTELSRRGTPGNKNGRPRERAAVQEELSMAYGQGATLFPVRDFTKPMSLAVIAPFGVTSVRKFACVTG
jgi:hypothetical protein